jgi:hypothetical protein
MPQSQRMKIRINDETPGRNGGDTAQPRTSNQWKWWLVAIAVVACALLATLRPHTTAPLPSGAVAFQGAGIFLVPGPGWIVIQHGGYTRVNDICLPVLQGDGPFKGSMIEVVASPSFPKEPAAMADSLVNGLRGDTNVVKGSIQRAAFAADSGLRGVHIWCRIVVPDFDRKGEVAAHCYLVTNGNGRCVRINVTAAPGSDAAVVHEMIRKTVAPS